MSDHTDIRRLQRGFWSVTAHPTVLEIAASMRPDFVCVDLQHGADPADVTLNTFTAIAQYGPQAFVRVPSNSIPLIGRLLDLGVDGIVVPFVDNLDEAREAVAACRYQPSGLRSFGAQSPRKTPTDRPVCLVQIETATGLEQCEQILELDGVDGAYVGPADLGLSLGGAPAFDVVSVLGGEPQHDAVRQALVRVAEACATHGKAAGLHCGSAAAAHAAEAAGYTFTSIATDVSAMRRDMQAQLDGMN